MTDRRERLHQRVWDLLPWYANGTLPDGERRTVEAHLAECPRCREEIAACRILGEAIRQAEEAVPAVHPARLARLMERIEDEERSGGGRGWRRLVLAPWQGLAALARSTPPLARGALVVQLVFLVALGSLLVRWSFQPEVPAPAPPPAQYRTLSESAPAAPETAARLRLVFAEGTTEKEARDLLLGIRGQIIAGPSALGVYTVEVPAGPDPLEKVLAHLRAQPRVSLAEPAVGP